MRACVFARISHLCMRVYVRVRACMGKGRKGRGVSAVYIIVHPLEDVYVLEETLEEKTETADGEMLHIKQKKLHVTGAGRRLQRVQIEPGVEDR